MKKTIFTLLAVTCLAYSGPVVAADKQMSGHEGMDHSKPQGNQSIRQTMLEGHHLSYELIDMKAKMKDMNMSMPDMKSHHLRLYIKDKDGNPVTNAKVGYLVKGPDGSTQKAMAMGMNKGFGADIDLKETTP